MSRQSVIRTNTTSVIRTNNTSLIRTAVDEDMGTEDVQEEQLPGNFSQKEDVVKVLPEVHEINDVGQIKDEEIEVSGHEQLMSNVYNPQLEQFNEKISSQREISEKDKDYKDQMKQLDEKIFSLMEFSENFITTKVGHRNKRERKRICKVGMK